jgi:hypothetical protein
MLKNEEHAIRQLRVGPRKSDRHSAILLLLARLGSLIPFLLLSSALCTGQSSVKEESRFVIYVDGKEIGYEKFSILGSSDAVESQSVVSFRDPGKTRKKVLLETELTMDGHYMPRAYHLRTDVEGQKGTVNGSFAPGEANFEYKGSGTPLKRGLMVGNRYIILDTNVFHHYIFIARLFDMRAGGTQSIEAVIPQELDGGKLKVKEIGSEVVPIHGSKMTLHHLTADSGMLLIDLWIDDHKILYKIAVPSKKIEAIRNR